MKRRMAFRTARAMAICLLLGLATTVAVAWGLAATADFSGRPLLSGSRLTKGAEERGGRYALLLSKCTTFGATHFMSFAIGDEHGDFVDGHTGPTPEDLTRGWAQPIVVPLMLTSLLREGIDQRPGQVIVDAVGWPFRSLWCEYGTSTSSGSLRLVARGAWVLADSKVKRPSYIVLFPLALPLRPLLAGLVADTAFYGTVWWLLIFAFRAMRRCQRHRRGWCIGCGYDLTGITGVCPECGRDITGPSPSPS